MEHTRPAELLTLTHVEAAEHKEMLYEVITAPHAIRLSLSPGVFTWTAWTAFEHHASK